MRDIRFRAWDKEEEKMWFDVGITIDKHIILQLTTDDGLHSIRPERAILMQFTGLKDKSGREIFEGDIVAPGKREVVFLTHLEYHEGVGFYTVSHETKDDMEIPMHWTFGVTQAEDSEIIGDIYSNPELLEKP